MDFIEKERSDKRIANMSTPEMGIFAWAAWQARDFFTLFLFQNGKNALLFIVFAIFYYQ